MKKTYLFLAITLLISSFLTAQSLSTIELNNGWKFKTGDNLKYAEPNFDDSNWNDIRVDEVLDDQGFADYDGFAWYRIKIVIPSTLKENTILNDSLKFILGKIDDYDQTFLNGKILGMNNTVVDENSLIDTSFAQPDKEYWNVTRRYVLPVNDDRILWDKENVIAIRIYDRGGLGGIFSGGLEIGMVKLSEYLSSNCKEMMFKKNGDKISKSFTITNNSKSIVVNGSLKMTAQNKISGKTVWEKESDIDIKPGMSQTFFYSLDNPDEPTKVDYTIELSNGEKQNFAVDEIPYILTPKESPKPKINGAKVYGQRPGMPFLYTIAATGKRPMNFDALDLPQGLTIDNETGIISGRVESKGEYTVKLIAENKFGKAERDLKIEIGDKIALTPPMGWNSWNCWGLTVDQGKVIASAKTFKEKGLINHGWSFINIDDGWEIRSDLPDPKRDENGNIITNEKFPDMKALGDSIHSLGLKFGIYSSPGPSTCGGYTASYQHELNDAESYASWGIDYLKYDWCSYGRIAKDNSLDELKKPYLVMNDALQEIDRDIVYSLCQYGMGKVWEWGESVGGNSWRTTGDITDTWQSMSTIGFNQIADAPYAGPGHWNDPDMLVVGWVGWGPNLHPSRLTPDEQYTHISLWCLLSSPLLIGCDLTKLDDFTLNLLTNDEVLSLNQDPLGKQATPIIKKGDIQVWVKELEDGNKAAGIFNLGSDTEDFQVNLNAIGYSSGVNIRDLWRQKELGSFTGNFKTVVPSHGVVLIKISE